MDTDPNNNGDPGVAKPEKYSLRPRSLRQKTEKGLDPRKDDLGHEQQPHQRSARSAAGKQKPPPLSKYRRKTANARERNRMREINIAFETLRRAVPHISGPLNANGNEKLTKITTLRLAMKYIQALRHVLDTAGPVVDDPTRHLGEGAGSVPSLSGVVPGREDPDLDVLLSDGESLHFNSDISESFASPDHPLTSPVSEPSENSPLFPDPVHSFPEHAFPFHDSLDLASDFPFEDGIPGSDFPTSDFFNSPAVRLL